MTPSRRLALGALLTLSACSLGLRAMEITLPPETARFAESPLPGFAMTTGLCSTCHSADYVRMQPPTLTRPAWKAIVTKMQKAFGAPLPNEAIDPIVDYVVKTYGAERMAAGDKRNLPAPPRTAGN